MELEGAHITPKDIEDNRKLFFNRYFGSQEFFSMRHMGNFSYRTKKISDYDINCAIGDQNIFDKNLRDLGMYLEPEEQQEKRDNRIKRKVVSYLYDILYHHNPDEPGKFCMTDAEKVYYLSEDRFISYELIKVGKHYKMEPPHILKSFLEVLEKVARNIITMQRDSDKYKDTIFYQFIKLPFYNEIKSST